MKFVLLMALVAVSFSAITEHSYTMGIYEDYDSLNYADGNVDIGMLYTTEYLKDITEWHDADANDGWESDFDSFYEDKLDQLYLQFEIYHYGSALTGADAMERCLVCMNVDENSELRDGDKGFAACYNTDKGNFFTTAGAVQYDDPEWTFLGEVKAVKKGTAVKSTGKSGWIKSGTWNKNKQSLADYCTRHGATTTVTGDAYYMFPYSDSQAGTDYIGLVSEKGFKNTGLNNGENHIRCWWRGYISGPPAADYNFADSEHYDVDWKPDFEADEGQSIMGWASTGTA